MKPRVVPATSTLLALSAGEGGGQGGPKTREDTAPSEEASCTEATGARVRTSKREMRLRAE